MNKKILIQLLFALIRSAISGKKMSDEELCLYSEEYFPRLLKIANKHDVSHLVILGMKQNGLISNDTFGVEEHLLKAVYRYEQLNFEYLQLCDALERAEIPFVPLKGSVLRCYYPEPWMRTSCDIDVLVHKTDLEKAVTYLVKNLNYTEKERTPHDVSLCGTTGNTVELHYDLVEEGRANNATKILSTAWDNVYLKENSRFFYRMTDEFFYFYHIAHMAKHFENGGCGIKPFADLWFLNSTDGGTVKKRETLLRQGNLLRFAQTAQKLSRVWFDNEEMDCLSLEMENYVLNGGSFGSAKNRISVQQQKKGGKFRYLWSKIFIPYDEIKFFYPILQKHRFLTPFMEVYRWLKLIFGGRLKSVSKELEMNQSVSVESKEFTRDFLVKIGLLNDDLHGFK